MSNESENKRIDLTQFEGMVEGPWRIVCWERQWYIEQANDDEDCTGLSICELDGIAQRKDPTAKALSATPDLIAELKRMYEREDALVSAIKELYYSEDNTGCSEDLTVVSLVAVLKLRDLTSE